MKTITALAALQRKTGEPWESTFRRMARNGFSMSHAARSVGLSPGTLHAFLKSRKVAIDWSYTPEQHSVDGITGSIAHLSRTFGVNHFMVYQRIARGEPVNRHTFRPAESNVKETFTVNGVTGNINVLAKSNGLSRGAVCSRLRRGYAIEDALTMPVATPREMGIRGQAALQQKLRSEACAS